MKKLFSVILSLGLIMAPVPVVSNAHSQSSGGMAQQLVGLANGIVGAGLITKCKMASMQPSVMVYIAGSITYLLGEITTAKKKTKDMGNMADSVNAMKAGMTEGGDYQKKIIQTQLDNENSNLQFAQKRKTFVTATLAIYAIATALAAFEAWRELPTPVGLSITSFANCQPNPASNALWIQAVAGAYAAISSSGGNLTVGGVAIGAVSGIAVAKFMPLLTSATKAIEAATVSGSQMAWGRAAFFAVMTALVYKIQTEIDDEIKKINERIATLKKVLDQLPGVNNGLGEGDNSGDAADKMDGSKDKDPNKDPSKKYAIKSLPTSSPFPKVCLGADRSVSEAACSAKTFQLPKVKLDAGLGFNTLQTATTAATDFSQAMINGDLGKAEGMLGSLQANAVKANKIKDQVEKKLADYFKGQGKKYDPKVEAKKQMDLLAASYAKQGLDISKASLGNPDIAGAAVSAAPAVDPNTASGEAVAKPSEVAVQAAPGTPEELTGISDAIPEPTAEELKTASLEDSLNQFESNESDIVKDSGVSIFKQVSNRYFLNYTKLFNRKKVEPQLAPEERKAE